MNGLVTVLGIDELYFSGHWESVKEFARGNGMIGLPLREIILVDLYENGLVGEDLWQGSHWECVAVIQLKDNVART